MTTEMSDATLPVMTFRYSGYEFNRLYGYTSEMDVALIRDNITPLADGRKLSFKIDMYGNTISKLFYELRSTDGERLIENTEIFNYVTGTNSVTADITLKDLIYKDSEYSLCIILENDKGQNIRYYTKIIDSDNLNLAEKLKFAYDFSNTTFDKVKAQTDLPTYLESNAKGDNSSFSYVDIHSSLNQITWGVLKPELVTEPMATIRTIDKTGAVIALDYFIKTGDGDENTYYRVDEKFRMRNGSERMFLLDYERHMLQSFSKDSGMLINNKIVLGISDENVAISESPDGNRMAFVNDGRLYTYNITDNKLAYVYGFYEGDVEDLRNTNNKHNIKIFNIDETGNVYFLVYGYMNRGMHEGRMGSAIYYYDSVLNNVEEKLYIESNQSYDLLKNDMEKVAYVNRHSQCFLIYGGTLYRINLENGSENVITENLKANSYVINKDASMIAWVDEATEYGEKLVIYNMDSVKPAYVNANEGEVLKPIGFFGNDLIYGTAYKDDLVENISGKTIFPMFKISIQNINKVIKEYKIDGVYVVDCVVEDTILNLSRASEIYEDGTYKEIEPDQILNNASSLIYKNKIEKAVTDRYETIIQIALKKDIDAKKLQILTPKFVILENNKDISATKEVNNDVDNNKHYYTYIEGKFYNEYADLATAINVAYENNGLVIGNDGRIIYEKRTRISKNQIMAISEPKYIDVSYGIEEGINNSNETSNAKEDSVAVCLNTILDYEGLTRDVKRDLQEGKKPIEILVNNLESNESKIEILDLYGCPLDVALNYVEKDWPVLGYIGNNQAVLIVGYNEFNTVLMNPQTGTVYKYGINDSTELFKENGNRFLTYIKYED